MATYYSPRSVVDGLVMFLDAGNTKSYPGSGSAWTNLANTSRNAIIRGTPTFSSSYKGAITTPADQVATYIELPESVLQNLTNGYVWTMTWALTVLSLTGTRYGPHMTVGGGNDFIWMWNGDNTCQLYAVGPYTGSNPTWALNTPLVLTLTRNSSDWRIYKNGVFSGAYSQAASDTKTITGWIADQEQDVVKGGFDGSQNLNANWHFFSFYDRIITDTEIRQNYNAIKGRLGLT